MANRRRRDWKRWVATGVVAALVAGMAATLGAVGSGGGDDNSDGAPDDGARAELTALLDRGRTGTYDATYTAAIPGVSTSLRLRLVRQPPRSRHDASTGPTDEVRTLLLETGPVRCRLTPTQPWTCEPQSESTTGEVDTVIAGFVAQLGGNVTATSQKVGGRDGRCFTGQTGNRLCLAPDGVVLSAEAGQSKLQLVELRHTVPPDAFTPPK